MVSCVENYQILMLNFLEKKLSAKEFQEEYIQMFKSDENDYPNDIYALLEGVFGDCDVCTDDMHLVDKFPNYYITESVLREKVSFAYEALLKIKSRS